MNDYIIETHDLTKKYGSQTSVSHLNIHVKKGRIYGLLGRNGAGKTTTMRMLLGLTAPTSGEVTIFGKPFQGNEKNILPRIGCLISAGLLPQFDRNGKPKNLCGTSGVEEPQLCQRSIGTCQSSLSGQELFSSIFPRYETASCYCAGCYARPGAVDFGRTDQWA